MIIREWYTTFVDGKERIKSKLDAKKHLMKHLNQIIKQFMDQNFKCRFIYQ